MNTRSHSVFVNALTFSRVPLIFAFMVVAMVAEFRHSWALALVACLCMGFAGLSDLLDGRLARKWKVVSAFGKLADPLMDKVFFIVAFPTLLWLIGMQGENHVHFAVMLVFTVLYILRDQWVTFLRAVASAYRADVSAMWLGKVRTALSFPAAGFMTHSFRKPGICTGSSAGDSGWTEAPTHCGATAANRLQIRIGAVPKNGTGTSVCGC